MPPITVVDLQQAVHYPIFIYTRVDLVIHIWQFVLGINNGVLLCFGICSATTTFPISYTTTPCVMINRQDSRDSQAYCAYFCAYNISTTEFSNKTDKWNHQYISLGY